MHADPLADLEIAAKELGALEGLTADQLVRAGRLLSLLDAVFARHAHLLDLVGAAEFEGFGSSRAWLAAATGMSSGAAGRHLRRGRYAFAHECTAGAWQAGELTGEHVDAVEYVWRHARDDAAFAEYEPMLVHLARHAAPADVAGVGRAWLERLEAERESRAALVDDERRAREEQAGAGEGEGERGGERVPDPADRWARDRSDADPFDGLLRAPSTFGFSDPVAGAVLPHGRMQAADAAEILQALETQMDRSHSEGDHRPRAQRMAQALLEICRQFNSQDINEGRSTPNLVIGADASVYAGAAVGPVRTTNGLLLTRAEMHRLACRSIITVISTGARGVLELGRVRRDFSRDQRRAVEHRDGPSCAFAGCAVPATRCEVHHIHWWELAGRTDIANGILLCWFHHRLVHEGRWAIEQRPDRYRFWRPDRREYRDRIRRPPPLGPVPTPTTRR